MAQSGNPMTNAQLTKLTEKGITLKLGGEEEGYEGSLKLTPDGKGKGDATTDAGKKITLAGKWWIDGDKFCRVWKGEGSSGKEVCEIWFLTSARSVEVFDGKNRIGVNSW